MPLPLKSSYAAVMLYTYTVHRYRWFAKYTNACTNPIRHSIILENSRKRFCAWLHLCWFVSVSIWCTCRQNSPQTHMKHVCPFSCFPMQIILWNDFFLLKVTSRPPRPPRINHCYPTPFIFGQFFLPCWGRGQWNPQKGMCSSLYQGTVKWVNNTTLVEMLGFPRGKYWFQAIATIKWFEPVQWVT